MYQVYFIDFSEFFTFEEYWFVGAESIEDLAEFLLNQKMIQFTGKHIEILKGNGIKKIDHMFTDEKHKVIHKMLF